VTPGEFSVINNRPLFSFGSRSMSPHHRRLYRAGYGLMIVEEHLDLSVFKPRYRNDDGTAGLRRS
jgi:hypothetical protein